MRAEELLNLPLAELRKIAVDLEVPNAQRLKKDTLIVKIRPAEGAREGGDIRGGILEIQNEGSGFLRTIFFFFNY